MLKYLPKCDLIGVELHVLNTNGSCEGRWAAEVRATVKVGTTWQSRASAAHDLVCSSNANFSSKGSEGANFRTTVKLGVTWHSRSATVAHHLVCSRDIRKVTMRVIGIVVIWTANVRAALRVFDTLPSIIKAAHILQIF